MKHDPLDPLMEGYLDYLANVRRQTPRTVTDVRCTLKHACQAMESQGVKVPLWKVTLTEYLHWIEQEREQTCSAGSLSKYLSHLRGLLDYAWRSGRTDRNVLDGFSLQDTLSRIPPRVLSIPQARSMIEQSPRQTFPERRDRMILLILYGCGLRTSELCNLNLSDVNRERGELFIRKGKGDVQRVVPIPEGVQSVLWAYLLDRGGKQGPLFRTDHKKARINSLFVCEVVTVAAQRAGIDGKVTPRTLRHSYATHLMDRGVDLAVISSLMGHRSPAETGVYLHVLKDRPKEAVDTLIHKRRKEDAE